MPRREKPSSEAAVDYKTFAVYSYTKSPSFYPRNTTYISTLWWNVSAKRLYPLPFENASLSNYFFQLFFFHKSCWVPHKYKSFYINIFRYNYLSKHFRLIKFHKYHIFPTSITPQKLLKNKKKRFTKCTKKQQSLLIAASFYSLLCG